MRLNCRKEDLDEGKKEEQGKSTHTHSFSDKYYTIRKYMEKHDIDINPDSFYIMVIRAYGLSIRRNIDVYYEVTDYGLEPTFAESVLEIVYAEYLD